MEAGMTYSPWLSDDNTKLMCKTVGNMDTNWGKYDHDLLIGLNLRLSKIYSGVCMRHAGNVFQSIKVWSTRFTLLDESKRWHEQIG